jgi:formate dehydrogenase subunit gamma
MIGAYRAMRYGYVDESWAEHHHLLWYKQVVAGHSRQKIVDPRAVPREVLEPRPRPA